MADEVGILPSIPDSIVPPGKYKAILDKIDEYTVSDQGEGKWAGKLACRWRFVIRGGDFDGHQVTRITIMPFYPGYEPVEAELLQKCWKFGETVTALCGGAYPGGLAWEGIRRQLIGTECDITVVEASYNGKRRNEVTKVEKLEGMLF